MDLVQQAEKNIRPYILQTPLVYSNDLSEKTGKKVYLKLESQQYTSSFKPRPAFNSILTHFENAKKKGVLTSSSGNFAQAVAYASKKLGVSAQIVMMQSASAYKKSRTQSFGAEIIECGNSYEDRVKALADAHEKSNRVLLHQYDTFETMAGDATVATEILDQFSEKFAILTCTSGGGLTAGVSFATKELRSGCEVYAVLPNSHAWPLDDHASSSEKTIADALVPAKAGENTFPITQKYVNGMASVNNDEIRIAMRALVLEQRLMTEPGGAVAVAALLANKFPKIKNKNVICILSGANIDFSKFTEFVSPQ